MLSSESKEPSPGSQPVTPNAAQSEALYAATIPAVDDDLLSLKYRRMKEQDDPLYIPLQAKPSLQSSDDTLFPLMEHAFEFLAGPGQVFLLLGDSGGGKSTFNLQLERTLWKTYKRGDPIPLHINLPSINNPQQDMVGDQLRRLDFSDTQIKELQQQNRQLIVICDGYDESQLTTNLHTTNAFNLPGQWNVKMIVTCRTQYLGPDYHSRFVPRGSGSHNHSAQDLFQEAVIAPFTEEQIHRYVENYVPLEPRTWHTQDYMDMLTTIPDLLDMVKIPFLLPLALEALAEVAEGEKDLSNIKITRAQIYDTLVRHWLEANKRRLEEHQSMLERNEVLPSNDRDMLDQLVDTGFIRLGIDFSSKLAQAIFDNQDGNPVVQYMPFSDKNTWKAHFFGPQPEARLLRESSPLTRTGNQFRFAHRSMLEYFMSCVIYNPVRIDNQQCDPQTQTDTLSSAATLLEVNGPLFQLNLVQEPSIIQFLCDRVQSNPDFEQQLRSVVNLSKTDSSAATAATNAITILVKAGAHFHGADLQGIKIPGADLSDGQFDSAQLQGADLTGVILSRSWLRQADVSGARMEGIRFGELPYVDTCRVVEACTYSSDGRMLAVSFRFRGFSIYDTTSWTVMHRFTTDRWVPDIAFSPNNQQIVSSGTYGVVRLWDCTSGKEVLAMSGHSNLVHSVEFSPCGKQIASASEDGTIRLWDSQTGENQFILKGHTNGVKSVKYSPNGRQLVSGSLDKIIRFWNPQTGEPGALLKTSLENVVCLAYSPDERWIASGDLKGDLRLWNASTKEPGPVLRGHSACVTGFAFSLSGQWVASSSHDQTVRLWDVNSGTLLSVWAGHNSLIKCVAFSPDGLQVASGGYDCKLRLWEVDSFWPSVDLRDGGRMDQIAYTPDGRTIFAQDSCRVLQQWDSGTGASSEFIPLESAELQEVSCMVFTRDRSQFAVGYKNGSIRLWNSQTSTSGPVLEGHSSEVHMLVYSPCCRWIASVDENNTVRVWNLHNMEQHRALVDDELEGSICVVVFSPTGGQVAVGYERGIVRLFDLPAGELLTCNRLTEKDLISMAYSPDGRQIAIGAKDGCIYLWDLQSEKPGVKLSGHEDRLRCIAYSPCGQWMASGCHDKTVGIWRRQLMGEAESWLRVHSICSFSGFVDSIAWNPVVPMELVTGCKDGSIRVWRLFSDERGDITVKMLWGSNISILCTDGLVFENAIGLSPVNQKLLIQRGAISPSVDPEQKE